MTSQTWVYPLWYFWVQSHSLILLLGLCENKVVFMESLTSGIQISPLHDIKILWFYPLKNSAKENSTKIWWFSVNPQKHWPTFYHHSLEGQPSGHSLFPLQTIWKQEYNQCSLLIRHNDEAIASWLYVINIDLPYLPLAGSSFHRSTGPSLPLVMTIPSPFWTPPTMT